MRTRLVALTLGALGSLAYACSSSTPNPYAEVSEYCSAYAQAICQIGTTSCQFDVSACQTYQASQCSTVATTAQKTRTYTSTNVKPCLDAINAAYGGGPASIPASSLNTIDSTCALVFLGTAGTNAACQTTQDCAVSGQICATAPGQTSKCATPTQRALGDQCLDTGDQCPVSAYCSSQQGTPSYGTCIAGGAAGAACSATTLCDNQDRCGVGGVCQALAAIGQDCCSSADCASSNYCDLFTDSNVPNPTCVDKLNGFGRGGLDCLGIAGTATSGCPSGSSSGSSSGGGADGGSGSGGEAGGDGANGD